MSHPTSGEWPGARPHAETERAPEPGPESPQGPTPESPSGPLREAASPPEPDAAPEAEAAPGAEAAPEPVPEPSGPADPVPLGVPRTATGVPEVDTRLDRLADADHLGVSGHLEVYEDVHQGLRDTLTALDRRPGLPAAPSPAPPAP